jgi:hypothetical protein
MKSKKSDQQKGESFDPDTAFSQMSELLTKVQNLNDINKKEAENQKQELNKEIFRLSKLNKEYYKNKIVKSMKKQKDS